MKSLKSLKSLNFIQWNCKSKDELSKLCLKIDNLLTITQFKPSYKFNMAESNDIIVNVDPKVDNIENKLVETGEKEVEEVDSPLLIISKILANPDKAKRHINGLKSIGCSC